ncbi:E3 ubiquitin-protein ligase TRIM21-like [Brienomyrus brachyistius]|uniref:E3 ubiquitin-protein ligase TRIM21-like n=1 Tax=Brienomyrus brachyistius TaxID=42636 RepID=UPI0020B347B6|nr:E3 ubiquitin-protein ligase TRIM21-like [Brienomyrus brachyistius]XP_048827652.1 E3 ubiquitin-protein ligase TRIM21-like [Brienomyrus brachyistius]XP_048827653.1 E3 ubiquitin-protein ligase TRIM21-like [Brienomyrus brachyistius]
MASSGTLLSEEQFKCFICSNVFTSPVSTPCGHSFCISCINKFWDCSEILRCPKCEELFIGRPELCENTFAKEMVEQFKKRTANSCEIISPRPEVPCDVCTSQKLRAQKSCLVCLISYCEPHLEPHLRVAALKRHKLVDPVKNLEDRMCKKHERPLELFCRQDQLCVCVLCTETEHERHDTVPVERECAVKKNQVGVTGTEIQQMIQVRLKKVEDLKQSVKLSKTNTERETEECVQVFTDLIRSIEKSQAQLIQMMEEKQKAAEQRTEGLIEELEKEIAELHTRYTELEELSQTEDHICFLQGFPSLCSIPQTKSWSDITVHSELFVGTVRSAVSRLESLLKMKENKLCEKELKRISQYAVNVTLDPKTANTWLVLSVDGKQVRDGNRQQLLPDTPERFDTAPIVLGKESFSSGRHYWEVGVGQKTAWDLGVASASVKRKGVVRLTPQDGYWTVCLRRMNEYRACAGEAVMLTLDAKPQKVGLYVDYEAGQVSFYNVEAKSHIYTFHGCIFTEKVLPFFNPDLNDNGDNKAPLVISPVSVRGEGACL